MNTFPSSNKNLRKIDDSPITIDQAAFPPSSLGYVEAEPSGNLMVEYYRTFVRHRWAIAAFAIAGAVTGVSLSIGSLPEYRARTSLDIQSLNSDFMNMRTVAPTGEGAESSSDTYVQTEIKLLQSETLLENTATRVLTAPHPATIEPGDLLSRLRRILHLGRSQPISYADLVDDAAKHVTVKPLGVTRLVEITCDSWSADFSAKFCNTLVDQFKEADRDMRSRESQKTSEWLTRQVADVKQQAEDSEKKLVIATGGNGLVLTQESTGVEEDRLRALQSEYVKAQADRMQRQAAAGIGNAVTPGMDPELGQSAAYHQYELKLADLKNEVAKLVPPATEENPKVIHLRSQIRDVEADMEAERGATAAHLKSDFEEATHRESMLAAAYLTEEGKVSSDLGKASQVALLRREVDSEQQLYQVLLQRAREAGFASAMQASTVRVVDAAKTPRDPFSPKRESSAASGLLLGTLVGVGFAFFRERNTAVFRVPGETERYLGLRELGVIPSAIQERKTFVPVSMSLRRADELDAIDPPALSNWNDSFSIVAEAYRSTTVSIMLSDHPTKQGRIYVISSPNASEGKTTISSNLGVALSRSRLRVLLIDGDLRKPGLHKTLDVANDLGLRNLLRTGILPDSLHPFYKATAQANLFVMPAGRGSDDVVELLHSSQVPQLMHRLRADFDVILIDTPPMLHMADARILATYAQGAILVLRAGLTTRDEASKARDLFEQDRVRMVGTILNDFNPEKNGLPGYYGSYYRYKEEVAAGKGTLTV